MPQGLNYGRPSGTCKEIPDFECYRMWVLKNGVEGISFRLRLSPFSSLTSVKWWLPQWVLSVGRGTALGV